MSTIPQANQLLKQILSLVTGQREAFEQERVYLRVVALVLGEILTQGRHCLTDVLRRLGLVLEDWSSYYRLWSIPGRFVEERLASKLFEETLEHVSEDDVYVVAVDTTSVARDSRQMEGAGWLKCPRNPPWKISIHRAQRFLNGSWLTPLQQGFSRAIPLRFMPAFTEKAVTEAHPPIKEQVAGLGFVVWIRQQLSRAGRSGQRLLCLADGTYDKPDFWKGLPEQTTALVRTARNRALCYLPGAYSGKGRRRIYGDPAPAPQDYLQRKDGWTTKQITVRGKQRRLKCRVEGPFLRRGMGPLPLFLIVVQGQVWKKGKRKSKTKRRDPAFYLVNAVCLNDQWQLPLPLTTLLSWAWQRWEVEVVHREVKSILGLGDKQCWNAWSAVTSIQWSAWVYALLMLAGYRTYGVAQPIPRSTAWQRQPRRWTLTTLLEQTRLDLATFSPFSSFASPTPRYWPEMEAILQSVCCSPPPSAFSPPSFFA